MAKDEQVAKENGPSGHASSGLPASRLRPSSSAAPPWWADWLLERFLPPDLLEDVLGDLHEVFARQVPEQGRAKAVAMYLLTAVQYLRPYFFSRKTKHTYYTKPLHTDMLRNYLLVARRHMLRHKGFTFINVFGLTVGLTACLLITLYVLDELSYDRYAARADRIYRIVSKGRLGGNDLQHPFVGAPAGPALVSDYPFIESYTRLKAQGGFAVSHGSKKFREEKVVFTDPNFFDVFSIRVLKGDPKNALRDPRSIVITEAIAQKYFGTKDPLGKTLMLGENNPYRVAGVCQDVPDNTHFHYQLFAPLVLDPANAAVNKWLGEGVHTYLVLKEGYGPDDFAAKNPEIIRKYVAAEVQYFLGTSLEKFLQNGNRIGYFLQPVTSIHLHSDLQNELEANGDIKYVYLFSVIALFILGLACINFMNLSTAGSSGRAREVGVRKVLGSAKGQLVRQFLTESLLVTGISALLALGLAWLLLPAFNDLAGKELDFAFSGKEWFLAAFIGVCLIVGLLAGSYPAFFLSSFKPVGVLKGNLSLGAKGGWLRSTLVVIQFTVSITLLIGTAIVYAQLHYIQTKRVGFDKEQILVLHDTHTLGGKAEALKNELLSLPQVSRASFAGFMPAGSSNTGITGLQPETAPAETYRTETRWIDEDYLPTMGIRLTAGRNFSESFGTDTAAVLLNEAAVRQFGWHRLGVTAIGKRLASVGNGTPGSKRIYTVIGVVKDFHFESMRHRMSPLVIMYGKQSYQVALRVQTEDLPGLLNAVERMWKAYSDYPFAYSFLNDRFNKLYDTERRTGQVFGVGAAIAVIIACLGLFGLVMFSVLKRTKEIGIRKVLGASVTSVVVLLSRDFLRLILLANAVAWPLAAWGMEQWLEDFAYKAPVSWWLFGMAGLAALGVALLTVSFQALKAALANPVDSLKSE
jgi:putative ABC transport system permease protein